MKIKLEDMSMNQVVIINEKTLVQSVCGGWIYQYFNGDDYKFMVQAVFVPTKGADLEFHFTEYEIVSN
jgi:hypothetical protein